MFWFVGGDVVTGGPGVGIILGSSLSDVLCSEHTSSSIACTAESANCEAGEEADCSEMERLNVPRSRWVQW